MKPSLQLGLGLRMEGRVLMYTLTPVLNQGLAQAVLLKTLHVEVAVQDLHTQGDEPSQFP